MTEVYDQSRVQSTLQKIVDAYNQDAAGKGDEDSANMRRRLSKADCIT